MNFNKRSRKITIQIIWENDIYEKTFKYNKKIIKFLNDNSLNLYKEFNKENYTYDFSHKSNCYFELCNNIYDLIYLEQEDIKFFDKDNKYFEYNKKHIIEYYL